THPTHTVGSVSSQSGPHGGASWPSPSPSATPAHAAAHVGAAAQSGSKQSTSPSQSSSRPFVQSSVAPGWTPARVSSQSSPQCGASGSAAIGVVSSPWLVASEKYARGEVMKLVVSSNSVVDVDVIGLVRSPVEGSTNPTSTLAKYDPDCPALPPAT